jgi:HK97 family phage portal protein
MKWPTWLNPLAWFKRDITVEQLIRLGMIGRDYAGLGLTAEEALGVSAVYCADRVIAEDLATLPMLVYSGHRLDDGAKPLFTDPITELLARPNPEQTGPVFWSQFQHNANIWGFAVAEIARDGTGAPRQLWPIASPDVRLDRVAGRLTIEVPLITGGRGLIDPADVLFLPGFSPNGSRGFQFLNIARQALGLAVQAQRYGANRFKNGMNPTGVIEVAGEISPAAMENMRASWRALYGGPDNVGVPLILEQGTKWSKAEIAHNDQLQLAQLLDLVVDDVARFFNVSPVKLHKLGRATWGNLETLNRDHVVTCLGPWIAKRDAEVEAKLLGPGRHCRHIVDRLLIAETSTRFAAWSAAVAGGWMKPNEARAREDLPPDPGGDQLLVPAGVGPAGPGAAAKPPAEVPTNEPARADQAQSA